MFKVVLASGNEDKLREFKEIFDNKIKDTEILPQTTFAIPEAAETASTFVENALLKARHACLKTGFPAIADDSGLEVDALKGAPGIFSARYAGENATYKDNREKLLADLKDIPFEKRIARFQCLIVYMRHAQDPTPIIAQGTWEGKILLAPQGQNGFGYDPIFFAPTHNCSAADLPSQIKNKISHRGQALQSLLTLLKLK